MNSQKAVENRNLLENQLGMREAGEMKTMVDLDRDIFLAVKDIAATQKKTPGKVLSELARSALPLGARTVRRNGVHIFAKVKGAKPVTSKVVNQLIDELM